MEKRMSIWNPIVEAIKPCHAKYDIDPRFLQRLTVAEHCDGYDGKYAIAAETIGDIVQRHRKKELLQDYISALADAEQRMRLHCQFQREHVLHTLNTYLLGIYINERFLGSLPNVMRVNHLEWKVAALFHDIGYLAQTENHGIDEFMMVFNSAQSFFEPMEHEHRSLDELLVLTNHDNSLALIQQQLGKWRFQIRASAIFDEVKNGNRQARHGVVSSLSALHMIDHLYAVREWNRLQFLHTVVPACAAIYVHSLKTPFFAEERIIPANYPPVAILLKLADCLQEWDRAFCDNPGRSADAFNISVEDGRLIFTANIPEAERNSVRDEIEKCLGHDLVKVIGFPNTP
jgi:hypothetical protein